MERNDRSRSAKCALQSFASCGCSRKRLGSSRSSWRTSHSTRPCCRKSSKKTLKVAEMRPLIAFMQDSFRVSERRACRVLPLIRSSCRRKSTRKDPVRLRQRIRDLAESRVRYGYRRIHILLQREGFKVGKDRVHRLYSQEGLSLRRKRPRRHVTAARRVERPKPQQKNQSGSMDFVSDALFDGRRFSFGDCPVRC